MLETCSDNDSDHSVSESHTLVTEMATKKTGTLIIYVLCPDKRERKKQET